MKFTIRTTRWTDLEQVLQIYAFAREQMKQNGNPSQWGDSRPAQTLIEQDIRNQTGYVIESDGRICGVFAFLPGQDPTYQFIEDGCWLNDEPYGTVHRVAGDGTHRGILACCLAYCERQMDNIRIDTHPNNHIMLHLLEQAGYQRCGIIYVDDGSARIAFQKECGRCPDAVPATQDSVS